MKIWSGSEGSHFLPDVRDWVNLWRSVLGAALQRVVFLAVFFSKTLPEPQRKELVFEHHPCVKITAGHGCFYHPVLALMCVWIWYGSDSAVLCSGSFLWGLPLVFWVGALGVGLVGLKHQCTQTILVFECLTLVPSGVFWDVQTCTHNRAMVTWILVWASSHSLTA